MQRSCGIPLPDEPHDTGADARLILDRVDELRDFEIENPDVDHVPPQLREHDGQRVKVEGIDRETGDRVASPGLLARASPPSATTSDRKGGDWLLRGHRRCRHHVGSASDVPPRSARRAQFSGTSPPPRSPPAPTYDETALRRELGSWLIVASGSGGRLCSCGSPRTSPRNPRMCGG